jgi:DNA replication protein DnaC
LTLWKDLRADFDEKSRAAIEAQRSQLINALLGDAPDTTDVDDPTQLNHAKLRNREDQRWKPQLERHGRQTDASLDEQRKTLAGLVEAVDAMVDESACFVPSPILVGPPGAGKTHLLKLGALYALSRGLNVTMMALTGER